MAARNKLALIILTLLTAAPIITISSVCRKRQESVEELRSLVGATKEQVKAKAGEPGKTFSSGDPSYPIPGYTKPQPTQFDACYAYYVGDRIVYLYFDENGRCFSAAAVGG